MATPQSSPAAAATTTPAVASYFSFSVGDVVLVDRRAWPGINQPGGVARVVAVTTTQAAFVVANNSNNNSIAGGDSSAAANDANGGDNNSGGDSTTLVSVSFVPIFFRVVCSLSIISSMNLTIHLSPFVYIFNISGSLYFGQSGGKGR